MSISWESMRKTTRRQIGNRRKTTTVTCFLCDRLQGTFSKFMLMEELHNHYRATHIVAYAQTLLNPSQCTNTDTGLCSNAQWFRLHFEALSESALSWRVYIAVHIAVNKVTSHSATGGVDSIFQNVPEFAEQL